MEPRLTDTGVERIAVYLDELTDYLCDKLAHGPYQIVSSRWPGEKSQIVCIRHQDGIDALALYAHLKQRKIITAPRGDRLRIAPHFYNTSADMDHLVASLP